MKFIVDTDGQIINSCIQGKNDIAQLNSLEKATLELIKKMPKWIPARCAGNLVAAEVNRPLAIFIKWKQSKCLVTSNNSIKNKNG